jgi:hypothetical protein
MAAKKSAQYPYQWPNGEWHSEPWSTHVSHQQPFAGVDTSHIGAIQGSSLSAPAPAPQPFDPNLEIQKLQAGMNVGLSGAESAWQSGQLQRSSGFDASGNLVTAGKDFNPFSQAMLLQDSYKRSKAGTNTGYAAQGQLYSGAYGRAQNRNDLNYAQGYDALRTGTLQGYHGIGAGQLQTYANNTLGLSGDQFQSLRRNVYGS